MKQSIVIERIGSNPRPDAKFYDYVLGRIDSIVIGVSHSQKIWVAKITGHDQIYGLKRIFLKHQRNYANANGSGSRGIEDTFILESGNIYEVLDTSGRYFCRIHPETGSIMKINKEEVEEWLKNR